MSGKCVFLGTGGSMGIPVIGCSCDVCHSDNPKNRRLRPSIVVEIEGKTLLVDPGPDVRQQALQFGVDAIDGVLITHAHNDHIAGIDELRVYYMWRKQPIPLLMSRESYYDIAQRFPYIFHKDERSQGLIANFDVQLIEGERGTARFLDLDIGYCSYEQAGMKVNGFRFGDFAYVSDIRVFPETIYEDLKGVENLVVSALRSSPSPLHFSVDEAIAFTDRVGAKRAWLTHIAHELEHDSASAKLPDHVRIAYDGLEVPF